MSIQNKFLEAINSLPINEEWKKIIQRYPLDDEETLQACIRALLIFIANPTYRIKNNPNSEDLKEFFFEFRQELRRQLGNEQADMAIIDELISYLTNAELSLKQTKRRH